MSDLLIFASRNGGEVSLKGNDLELTDGLFNHIFLALFGGNVEANTQDGGEVDVESEQNLAWWGNVLFFENEPDIQFNSESERVSNTTVLNSSGRIDIEEAVKTDLAFMKDFAEVTVSVIITGNDRVEINVSLKEPDNIERKDFQFIWDATRVEEIDNITI